MRRGGPLNRRTPVNRVNRKRQAARDERAKNPQSTMARLMCCCACGAPPPVDAEHLQTQGSGGPDRGNVTPLCRGCHGEKGWGVEQFEARRAPFWLAFPEDGEAVKGPFWTLQEVATQLERMAYPLNRCGCTWDWLDEDGTCVEPDCLTRASLERAGNEEA